MAYVGKKPQPFYLGQVDDLSVQGDAAVTGNLTVTGTTITMDSASVQTVDLGDNDKIRLGDADDAQIYHDGTNTIINNDTGNIAITGSNVGIGTSSPSTALDVNGDITIADNGEIFDKSGNQRMRFYTPGSTDILNPSGDRIRLDSSGNFLVGTTTASAKLDVLGSSGTNTISGVTVDNGAQIRPDATGAVFSVCSNGGNVYLHSGYNGGDMIFSTRSSFNNTERMRLDDVGKLSIGSANLYQHGGIDATRMVVAGTSSSSSNAVALFTDTDGTVETNSTILAVGYGGDSSFTDAYYINFFDSGGQQGRIQGNGANAVTYASGSDERLKSNIRNTDSKWDSVKQIQVRDFEWSSDESNTTVTGFIAQELNDIIPDAVGVGGDDVTKDPWVVDYGRTTPVIIKALQEAMERIETLEAEVATLKGASA